MHVSIRIKSAGPEVLRLGLVAFEFGKVLDPHEALQDTKSCRQWEITPENVDRVSKEIGVTLMDRHRGLLGRRSMVWADDRQLALLRERLGWITPWEADQVRDPTTLVWVAKRVPSVHYRVPAAASLSAGSVLHEAVQQTVLLQGAFRALDLHNSPAVLCPPTM